ncbi:MAG: aspartate 1-decarboxylase [Candidatus Thalassarchaeaceae archaeon]|nr:aspartate 1-decarboxylase [Candidatus Thalassarchaeaceae archaeon]
MGSSRHLLKSKIHRALITDANLNYIGSISIDEELMDAADIIEWERIQVLNITNGNRLETYVIKSPKGSKEICINGAAAHLVNAGDLVILCTYATIDYEEASKHIPNIIHVNNKNEIINPENI